MLKNCPFCGTPLLIKSNNKSICPNCGIIEEIKKEEDRKDKPSYFG
jgi:uncharacterized Zn finger protein (UPF0148 family)